MIHYARRTLRGRLIAVSLLLALLAGCVTVRTSTSGQSGRKGGGLRMIYGRGISAPKERDSDAAQYWMTVHVTLSDSTYEFGHLPDDGGFDVYGSGHEGRFRTQGGDVRHFAIREVEDSTAVYSLARFGSYRLTGPSMSAARAVWPRMSESYYSIAIMTFEPSRHDTVTVELVASSPNGFSPAP